MRLLLLMLQLLLLLMLLMLLLLQLLVLIVLTDALTVAVSHGRYRAQSYAIAAQRGGGC